MKLQVRTLTDTEASLVIEGANHALLNAIRRALLADVPKMAIEDVTIYDNTSALFDEIVSHRLGLVPIPTDLAAFAPRAQCTCDGEGCANCTILYTLSKEGPTMVTSGDLTPADPRFRVKEDGIPIVKLLEGQRIMLEAAAVMNTGTTHAKYAPAHAVAYREFPHAEVRDSPPIPANVMADLQRAAPPGAVSFEGGRMSVLDVEKAFTFLRSAKKSWGIDAIRVWSDKERFIFSFETDGAITPKDALQRAIAILMEKLKIVESEVPKLKLEEPAPAA